VALLFDKIDPKRPHTGTGRRVDGLCRGRLPRSLSSKTFQRLQPTQWKGLLAGVGGEGDEAADRGHANGAEVEAYYLRGAAYLTLESRQLFLEPAVVEAAEKRRRTRTSSSRRRSSTFANAIDSGRPHDAIRRRHRLPDAAHPV